MNENILTKEVQEFIRHNRGLDATKIALGKSPFAQVSSQELAAQIDGLQRCVKKLPTWAFHENIYYPNRIHIEQSSSEHTALYKQSLIKKKSRVIDLTGGLGVDSVYMAQSAASVIHCEYNKELSQIAAHNAKAMKVNNIEFEVVNGIQYLSGQEDDYFDYVYVDPSRRKGSKRVFLLEECEPDILANQKLFFEKGINIITKISPLFDIHLLLEKLNWIKSVHVISVDNECKEVLLYQKKGYIGIPKIHCIRLYRNIKNEYTFTFSQEQSATATYSLPQKWLYDPDVSITKAGAFKSIASSFRLHKLAQHTHLYTSQNVNRDFPGRIFNILEVQDFSSFKKHKGKLKANIITKNFPTPVKKLRKRFKINEGGELYMYFTSNQEGKQVVIFAQRID
ncbi:MAG TPA: hypothetical protein VK102_05680 [Sphingobacterium sp.]|nr:hypothetical protein [Sphingobacterium sp.]